MVRKVNDYTKEQRSSKWTNFSQTGRSLVNVNSPLLYFWMVDLKPIKPSTFILKYHSIHIRKTVQFLSFGPLFDLWIQFRRQYTLCLLDRLLSSMTVHFRPDSKKLRRAHEIKLRYFRCRNEWTLVNSKTSWKLIFESIFWMLKRRTSLVTGLSRS